MYPISRRRQCLPKQQHGRRALPQVMKMIVVMKVRGLCGSELLGVAADSCACIASDPFHAHLLSPWPQLPLLCSHRLQRTVRHQH